MAIGQSATRAPVPAIAARNGVKETGFKARAIHLGFRQNKGRAFYNGSGRLRLAGVLAISLGTFSDKLLCISTMSQIESQNPEPVFQLKGSMLAITVMELARTNLEALDRQLAAKVAQAPNFFSNTPLILALDKLAPQEGPVDLPGLVRICRQHGLRTLAIRANRIEDIAAAIAVDLPVLPPSGARERVIEPVEAEAPKKFRKNRPNP